uniref:Ig-like domain-containing protein n=1 Tax=Gopherus evgoodei TaxID=1825980 RepID=A0A8C5EWR6_9SAUR
MTLHAAAAVDSFPVYVWGIFHVLTGVSVMQTQGPVSMSEGEGLRLNCSYDDATVYAVFWYVQFPSQPPRFLLRHLGREDSDEGIRRGFNATHDKKNKSFHLSKPASDLSDSGTYYCATSNTVTQTGRGTEQKPHRVCAEQRGSEHREGKGGMLQTQNLDLWSPA